ncbi:MAG: MFS transporter [Planctomycetia bacterium]|jgi:predicted MFS family arabinose efflux permease|nr:MFS transporter [Planctomycetia bacterium]MCC7316387.1 MFS transporter [Planctomycetota bacterium]OQY98494.1 MAG: MFS transporter [Planctomycetes bacterium UTPLA1]
MASVTFVGILSELVPSGILPQMTAGLGIEESEVGFLVGVYALASAIAAIPLISATLAFNRKTLLMALLIGFAASNIVVGLSSSYAVIIAFRIVGGICAGVMWPMIAAYGTRLVPDNMHGKAITVIMSGNTLGISIGLPAMTAIGLKFGWRSVFMVLGMIVAVIAVLSYFYLPAVKGEKLNKSNSPLAALKMPSILIVLLLTFLSVAAHYGIYTYITLLVEMIGFAGGIGLALLIFGIGSVISVIGSAKYIDAYLRPLIVVMLAIGAISMAMFLAFDGTIVISHIAFFLWGLAFGPLVTMYQTAVSKQVEEAKDVATSVQSSVFNLSIMGATWVGGMLLSDFPITGVKRIVYMSLACFVLAIIIAFLAKRTLRSSTGSSDIL